MGYRMTLFFFAVIFSVVGFSQNTKITVDRLEVKQSLKIGSQTVTSISMDSTFGAATNLQVPTANAVKKYVDSRKPKVKPDTVIYANSNATADLTAKTDTLGGRANVTLVINKDDGVLASPTLPLISDTLLGTKIHIKLIAEDQSEFVGIFQNDLGIVEDYESGAYVDRSGVVFLYHDDELIFTPVEDVNGYHWLMTKIISADALGDSIVKAYEYSNGLLNYKTLYVSKSRGDNLTAQGGNINKPFSDPFSAADYAEESNLYGVTIVVDDGAWTYSPGGEINANVRKGLVRRDYTYHFAKGTKITTFLPSSDSPGLFSTDTITDTRILGLLTLVGNTEDGTPVTQLPSNSNFQLEIDSLYDADLAECVTCHIKFKANYVYPYNDYDSGVRVNSSIDIELTEVGAGSGLSLTIDSNSVANIRVLQSNLIEDPTITLSVTARNGSHVNMAAPKLSVGGSAVRGGTLVLEGYSTNYINVSDSSTATVTLHGGDFDYLSVSDSGLMVIKCDPCKVLSSVAYEPPSRQVRINTIGGGNTRGLVTLTGLLDLNLRGSLSLESDEGRSNILLHNLVIKNPSTQTVETGYYAIIGNSGTRVQVENVSSPDAITVNPTLVIWGEDIKQWGPPQEVITNRAWVYVSQAYGNNLTGYPGSPGSAFADPFTAADSVEAWRTRGGVFPDDYAATVKIIVQDGYWRFIPPADVEETYDISNEAHLGLVRSFGSDVEWVFEEGTQIESYRDSTQNENNERGLFWAAPELPYHGLSLTGGYFAGYGFSDPYSDNNTLGINWNASAYMAMKDASIYANCLNRDTHPPVKGEWLFKGSEEAQLYLGVGNMRLGEGTFILEGNISLPNGFIYQTLDDPEAVSTVSISSLTFGGYANAQPLYVLPGTTANCHMSVKGRNSSFSCYPRGLGIIDVDLTGGTLEIASYGSGSSIPVEYQEIGAPLININASDTRIIDISIPDSTHAKINLMCGYCRIFGDWSMPDDTIQSVRYIENRQTGDFYSDGLLTISGTIDFEEKRWLKVNSTDPDKVDRHWLMFKNMTFLNPHPSQPTIESDNPDQKITFIFTAGHTGFNTLNILQQGMPVVEIPKN
jgi:hypothetical protein